MLAGLDFYVLRRILFTVNVWNLQSFGRSFDRLQISTPGLNFENVLQRFFRNRRPQITFFAVY